DSIIAFLLDNQRPFHNFWEGIESKFNPKPGVMEAVARCTEYTTNTLQRMHHYDRENATIAFIISAMIQIESCAWLYKEYRGMDKFEFEEMLKGIAAQFLENAKKDPLMRGQELIDHLVESI